MTEKMSRNPFCRNSGHPTMAPTDVRVCAALARGHGLVLAVDNTFSSPILQNPLDLGADLVIKSAPWMKNYRKT